MSKSDLEYAIVNAGFVILMGLGLLYGAFSLNRNSAVYDFRIKVFHQVEYRISEDNKKGIDSEWRNKAIIWMPSYGEMMWSLKPLESKYWFNPDPTEGA